MTNPTAPQPPRRTTLRRVAAGRLPAFLDRTSRFTVTRNPAERGVPFEDSGYDVVDTKRRNILGHAHTNRVRVYELDDARAIIDRVLRVEYLAALQRFIDGQRAAMGLPSIAEEAATRSRRERTEFAR